MKKYLSDVGWLGLVSPHLNSEFYDGILLKKSESTMHKWDTNNIYTFFDGKEQLLTPTYLGELINWTHYFCP